MKPKNNKSILDNIKNIDWSLTPMENIYFEVIQNGKNNAF